MIINQSKKPKFLFTLSIQELANIPKIAGRCYVKWHIKETAKQSLKGKTEKSSISDYRASWKYTTEALIKLTVSKTKELQEKILQLVVYVEDSELAKSNSIDSKARAEKRSVLGKVEINLAEYVNYDEPTTNRYLLQQSKVNCILNVKIGMELLKGDKSEFIAPHLKNNNIFKGISTVFNDSTSSNSPTSLSQTKSNSVNGLGSQGSSNDKYYHHSFTITSDPVLSKLYERTFEISWDPRPGEFNAQDCIEDIFNGGDGWAKNEDGINLMDLKDIELDKHTENKNGSKLMLKESDIRPDLKSWQITKIL